MKFRILCALFTALTLPVSADEPTAPTAPPAGSAAPAVTASAPAASVDLSSFKTADDLYAFVQQVRKGPTTRPNSREEAIAMQKEYLNQLHLAADAFIKTYPTDPRRYVAEVLDIQALLNGGSDSEPESAEAKGKAAAIDSRLAAILASSQAEPPVKAEAAYLRAEVLSNAITPDDLDSQRAFFHAAEAFQASYGESPQMGQLTQLELQVAADSEVPEAEAFLKKLAEFPQEEVAAMAKSALNRKAKIKELKAAPLDLKFTDISGKAVDAAQLRGKVVMLDFWASWCGPCMAEMPNIVSVYNELHDKGFEIIGVSLDEEQDAMNGALKKMGVPWPQSFDGGGWKSSIATSFAITSIPSTWIFDKKGLLRANNKFGKSLVPTVEKLLAE